MARVPLSSLPNGTVSSRQLSGALAAASGATALVYTHGTTTQVTVYSAETGTGTLGQPLTADVKGQLPGWVSEEQALDVVATFAGVTSSAAVLEVLNGTLIVDVMAYGAMCDGATDDTAAWNSVFTAFAGTGATIRVSGNSLVSQITVPDGSVDLTIEGNGSQHNGARTGCITSNYGGSGPVLQAHGARGFQLKCSVVNTNAAFTGDLVDIQRGAASGDTTMFTVENCQLQAVAQASAVTLLRLTKATAGRVRGVYFYGGKYGIEGKVVDGDYCNANVVEQCYFDHIDVACIHNLGDNCIVDGNTFEPLRSGAAGAYLQDATVGTTNITFRSNWTGDGNGTGTWYTVNGFRTDGSGGTVAFFGGKFDAATTGIQFNATAGQFVCIGGRFNNQTTAVDLNSQTFPNGVAILGNQYRSISGTKVNTAGASISSGQIIDTGAAMQIPVLTGTLTLGGGSTNNGALFIFNAAATAVLTTEVAGDTGARFQMLGSGSQNWGPGNTATDTSCQRIGAGILAVGNQLQQAKATPTYSTSITPDASAGPWQTITVTNSTAFTINAPTSPPSSARTTELTVEVLNSAGGAMGVITWNAAFIFATGAWTNPASTKKRFARFEWNGASWICTSLATADY